MKILFLSSYTNPAAGPSTLNRLAEKLRQEGHEVLILTTGRQYDSDIIKSVRSANGLPIIDRAINKIIPNYFSSNIFRLVSQIKHNNPDVVNIHWTHGQVMPIQIIPWLNRHWPVFWTIHDLWPLTGNTCVDDSNGETFVKQSKSLIRRITESVQLSPRILLWYKTRLLRSENIHTISPSRWMLDKVNASPVFRSAINHHVPNGVDCNVFRPLERSAVRAKYNIAPDVKVVLFLSANVSEPWKGFFYFAKALERIKAKNPHLVDKITTVLVGENSADANRYLVTEVKNLEGTGDPSTLAEYYNLADIFVSASISDNFPSTLLESSACGTPVVAFDVGGVPEIVIDNKTGLLSKSKDTGGLAANIERVLSDEKMRKELGRNCRSLILAKYSIEQFVQHYETVFQSEKARRDNSGWQGCSINRPFRNN